MRPSVMVWFFSSGSNPNRRRVRPLPYRSSRKGDFLEEHGAPGKEVLVDIRILYEEEDLPAELQDQFEVPVLYYHTRQYRDDILIASTRSYIANCVDLKALRAMLKEEGAMIYDCLKQLGADPVDCQENLISSLPNDTERADLDLPQHASIPIVRITRKAFEPDGRCIQVCYMSRRQSDPENQDEDFGLGWNLRFWRRRFRVVYDKRWGLLY
jgi:GntR family transcriptional regulator